MWVALDETSGIWKGRASQMDQGAVLSVGSVWPTSTEWKEVVGLSLSYYYNEGISKLVVGFVEFSSVTFAKLVMEVDRFLTVALGTAEFMNTTMRLGGHGDQWDPAATLGIHQTWCTSFD